eukprot:gene33560-37928_t
MRAGDVLGRVTLVTGKEEFLNERTITAVREVVRSHDPESEISETGAAELTLASLGELSAPSLFSTIRCVVVRSFEQLPDESVEVVGDEHALHQVVTNLLTNARKYTPAGTEVAVSIDAHGFVVTDDGPGFPPDLVEHAFERFARGDAARHREGGVGLGLALVQAIVTAHGGH